MENSYKINDRITVNYQILDETINVQQMLSIDPSNLVTEAFTFNEKIHALGVEKNKAENNLRRLQAKLKSFEISMEAERLEHYRSIKKEQGLTEAMIKAFVERDLADDFNIGELREEVLDAEEQVANVSNLFWVARSKMEQLAKMRV